MEIWNAGDIITGKKWESLSTITPYAKKLTFLSDGQTATISFSELSNLIENGVELWTYISTNPDPFYLLSNDPSHWSEDNSTHYAYYFTAIGGK